ncbi:hypothetical protein [Pseudomonas serbica]
MKFSTDPLKRQLAIATEHMPIEDLIKLINSSLSSQTKNDEKLKCPSCKALLEELPSSRLSAQELRCPSCDYACLYYRGKCRTIDKNEPQGGSFGTASIRCYDTSGLERFIELTGWFMFVSKIEMKAKDEFSLLLPLLAAGEHYAAGPAVFKNITLRSTRALGKIKIYMFDEQFPELDNIRQ